MDGGGGRGGRDGTGTDPQQCSKGVRRLGSMGTGAIFRWETNVRRRDIFGFGD